MTDVNIKELLAKSDADLRTALEAMLPKPTYPAHLLGLWAKHPEYGDVMCAWDKPSPEGRVFTARRAVDDDFCGASVSYLPISELTFPEQTTKPENVPVGEAWLVDVEDARFAYKRVVALKMEHDNWWTSYGRTPKRGSWSDDEVTLIAPLEPAQPEPEKFLAIPGGLKIQSRTVTEWEDA